MLVLDKIDPVALAKILESMFTDAYREYSHLQDIAYDDDTDMETYHQLTEKCDKLQARFVAIADVAEKVLDADLYTLCEYIDE